MVEAARARNDGLLGREPSVGGNAFGNQCTGFNIWSLYINRADAELFIPEQTLEIVRPIMLNQV